MNKIEKKERTYPKNPEWRIILDLLVNQDQDLIYRICRKMIIDLDRKKIKDIFSLIEALNPSENSQKDIQNYGPNWPKPKGTPFIPLNIIDVVFNIADNYYSDEEIKDLLTNWIRQEKYGFLSNVLEKRHAPLADVVESVNKFLKILPDKTVLSLNEWVGLRVALILRFLSEDLNYINVAKHFITVKTIGNIINRIVGPALGNGKLGGKAAGIILATSIIEEKKKTNPLLENILSPKSWFLTSDGILEYMHYNALEEFTFTKYLSNEEIQNEYQFTEYIFKNSTFPTETIFALNKILDDINDRPIVVRSSSLLEDSFDAAFCGKYKSLFISNIGTREERLNALMNAIAEVYASTFGPDPIEYRKERGLLDFREEMGVLIQEVVGTRLGKYFLPSFAGVAFSHNEFRWSNRIQREDGVVRLVAGLGTRAVDRTMTDYPTLVSPGKPDIRVNVDYKDVIKYTQEMVDVINLETNRFETVDFLTIIDNCKGQYPLLEKIVSIDKDGNILEPVSRFIDYQKEGMVITFNSLIRHTDFITQIRELLYELKSAFGSPVDIEFACDGKNLFLLQCRPQSQFDKEVNISIPINIPSEFVIFSADQYVSNGLVDNIEYIVYVVAEEYTNCPTKEKMYQVGKIISKLNRVLPRRKFILLGPGRWGSKGDIKLGVPVLYSDINNTAMLIEIAKENSGYVPELSFGTHFFQDLVEANIKYLPLYPDRESNIFNNDFFEKSNNSLTNLLNEAKEYENIIQVIKISDCIENSHLSIFMDGTKSEALAFIKKNF